MIINSSKEPRLLNFFKRSPFKEIKVKFIQVKSQTSVHNARSVLIPNLV
uniref:Uncharacterized protein n=1 Tax=Anguilla anguilla TaxID=7936 RepID=A0A0E9UGL1_ANGAN